MAINLAVKYSDYVDEIFTTQAKRPLISNEDYDWINAHTVKVYKVSTATMGNYDRAGSGTGVSRYGNIQGLNAVTEDMTLSKDRSFTYAIDKLDEDETNGALDAANSLARQIREVIIPEVDTHVISKMVAKAGKTITKAITSSNVYTEIVAATEELDNNEVPDTERVLMVNPSVYAKMKENPSILMSTDVDAEARKMGVIAYIDGCTVIKVPAIRLGADVEFIMCHPSATVAPIKLEDYKIHEDAPFINGSLVEGRVTYDAFVLDNKEHAIYVCKAK
mgnify:CR=1 FL=1